MFRGLDRNLADSLSLIELKTMSKG